MSGLLESGVVADFRVLAPAAALFCIATAALLIRRVATRRAEREDRPPAR